MKETLELLKTENSTMRIAIMKGKDVFLSQIKELVECLKLETKGDGLMDITVGTSVVTLSAACDGKCYKSKLKCITHNVFLKTCGAKHIGN